jgi:UDP:flavonoid glycosyltransferase YjiC (YdhE family)
MAGMTPPFRIEGWINQKMVLHHNNTKVFLTHAGLGSLSKSI